MPGVRRSAVAEPAACCCGGSLVLNSQVVTEHRHKGKDKPLPSGLFAQPEAEHLAAVIFTNSATVSKFGRMGTERGHGPDDVAMARCGLMYDPDPDAAVPVPFTYVVGAYGPEEHETFSEGFHVLHNPWARIPVADGALDGFTEHRLQPDGRQLTTFRQPDYFLSRTYMFRAPTRLSWPATAPRSTWSAWQGTRRRRIARRTGDAAADRHTALSERP